jgi:hypothetical protein
MALSSSRRAMSGHEGGNPRTVPMTSRLAAALAAHRHLRGPRVLTLEDGGINRAWLYRAMQCGRAGESNPPTAPLSTIHRF